MPSNKFEYYELIFIFYTFLVGNTIL